MTDEFAVNSGAEAPAAPPPIDAILQEGREARKEGRQAQTPDRQAAPEPHETSQQPAGSDGSPPEQHGALPWQAIKQERIKRQAYAAQNRELQEQLRSIQEERDALLARETAGPAAFDDEPDPVHVQVRQGITRVSKEGFVSRYGDAAYRQLDSAFSRAYEAGDPEARMLVHEVFRHHNDPIAVAAHWAMGRGLWAPPEQQPGSGSRQSFPSNFATARNVGARNGPAWAGQTPLGDIFNRRKKAG